jgi:hypothetical protein
MRVNEVPFLDESDTPTHCCPRFQPGKWDGVSLQFRDKRFVRATTRSANYVPRDMGRVFNRVGANMMDADAWDPADTLVLSRNLSPWQAEHLFAAARPVPEEEMTALSGAYLTRVFEGPYRRVRAWHREMEQAVRARDARPGAVYFFYTACPRCARAYGVNYVVGVAALQTEPDADQIAMAAV